jgi:3-phenylpropionate/trans-cinnamate dioxygenase ferredoxin reductase component
MSKLTFVIVGASLAGAKAAETLRDAGFEGRVVLIGSDPQRPYQRPPLSKDYLRGEAGLEKVYVHDSSFYETHSIELRTSTTVESIAPGSSEVVLAGGARLRYDGLLLTTGAYARRMQVPGADLDGIFYLRTLEDCDRLRSRLALGGRLVVVGAGWIGSEVAASARQMGLDVTVLDAASVPLERVLGAEAGAVYRDLHHDHGVRMLLGTGVEKFEGSGWVKRVRTSGGSEVECDFVAVGVGAVPHAELAVGAGIRVQNGIVTDEFLQTAVPGVFAAGDVANAQHPLYGPLRLEHWANALNQGPAAARSMLARAYAGDRRLDPTLVYDRLPYFYSDQYEVGMEYSGYATDWDEVVFRGDVAGREFTAFWLRDRRVQAGMNVNVGDGTDQIQALIRSGRQVDPARLGDIGTPLAELTSGIETNLRAEDDATHGGSPPSLRGRQDAEVEAIVRALSRYGVLTRARLLEFCGAAHWSDSGAKRAIAQAISDGRIRQLDPDLYEISEPSVR